MDIYERDGWRCGICRKPVRQELYGQGAHRDGPSIDHIVPVSLGGVDASWNVRLTHLRCNARRGNRGDVQMQMAA
jgi:5-methylcytosine-specific restriction endonuclease McrA